MSALLKTHLPCGEAVSDVMHMRKDPKIKLAAPICKECFKRMIYRRLAG